MRRSTPRTAPYLVVVLGWVPFSQTLAFCIDNTPFVASCWCSIHSHSIRSDKVPVWSQRPWREYAAMAVSTCTSNLRMVCNIMGVLQHSTSLLCNPKIHTIRNHLTINAYATQSCTASSTHAPYVREGCSLSALPSYCFLLDSSQLTSYSVPTIRGQPIVPPMLPLKRKSQGVFTGSYAQPSTPASQSRSQMACEYPSGPITT